MSLDPFVNRPIGIYRFSNSLSWMCARSSCSNTKDKDNLRATNLVPNSIFLVESQLCTLAFEVLSYVMGGFFLNNETVHRHDTICCDISDPVGTK